MSAIKSIERKATTRRGRAVNSGGMVRVTSETHRMIRYISERENISLQSAVERAIKEYDRISFFRRVNEDYLRLQADPEAWAEELAERKSMEGTLMDGIDRDEIWGDDRIARIVEEK